MKLTQNAMVVLEPEIMVQPGALKSRLGLGIGDLALPAKRAELLRASLAYGFY
jgi:hypothetical protein